MKNGLHSAEIRSCQYRLQIEARPTRGSSENELLQNRSVFISSWMSHSDRTSSIANNAQLFVI